LTKYEGETSPTSFLETMAGELELTSQNTEANKLKYLPLLLKGKASYLVDRLRTFTAWNDMKTAFVDEFTVDPNVVIGELRALRCVEYDV
jgi:hypothetical protein